MALNSNALTSVYNLLDYMGGSLTSVETFSVYNDESDSATAATVAIASDTISMVVTTGGNAGTHELTLSDYLTTTLLVAAINDLDKGFVAKVTRSGNEDPQYLDDLAAVSCFGRGAIQYLVGRNTLMFDMAINIASGKMASYCGREFVAATYTHMYHGRNLKELQLRYFPLIQVYRVSIGRREAIKLRNTNTDAIQANVGFGASSMTLDVVGGANAGSETIEFTEDVTTLTTTVAAINALETGWEASIWSAADGGWFTSDLFQFQPRDALSGWMTCYAPYETEDRYDTNLETGTLFRTGWGKTGSPVAFTTGGLTGRSARPHELRPITADSAGPFWPEGMANIYVKFRAGFATIPSDLEGICMEYSKNILLNSSRNTSLTGEQVEGYSWTSGFTGATGRSGGEGALSAAIRTDLEQWRMYFMPEYVEA